MYKKMLFLLTIVIFLLASGQSHCQTEVLWSKWLPDFHGAMFSKDGKVVVAVYADTLYLLDAYTGEPTMYEKVKIPGGLRMFDISKDGQYIGVVSPGIIRILNYNTGETVKQISDDKYWYFKFLPDSEHFITIHSLSIHSSSPGFHISKYNIESGEIVMTGYEDTSNYYLYEISQLAVSNDKNYFCWNMSYLKTVSSDYSVCSIKLWDAATLTEITTLNYSNALKDLDFSPDGKYLASADQDGYIKVWNVETRELIVDMLHSENATIATKLVFSNNSKYLITGGGPFGNQTTKIWNLPFMELIHIYEHPFIAGTSLGISSNDSLLVGDFHGRLSVLKTNFDPTSVEEQNVENDTVIIPNPVKDILNIELKEIILGKVLISLYNSSGKQIKDLQAENIYDGATTLTFDVSFLPTGNYFVRVESNNFNKTFSFIKL